MRDARQTPQQEPGVLSGSCFQIDLVSQVSLKKKVRVREGGWLKRTENDAKNLSDLQIRLTFENHPLYGSHEITF